MQIYQKQYRVKFEKDKYGKKCEFTYIPCSRYKGMEIYRNGDNVIGVYIPSINVGKRIAKEYPLLFRIEKETSCEILTKL